MRNLKKNLYFLSETIMESNEFSGQFYKNSQEICVCDIHFLNNYQHWLEKEDQRFTSVKLQTYTFNSHYLTKNFQQTLNLSIKSDKRYFVEWKINYCRQKLISWKLVRLVQWRALNFRTHFPFSWRYFLFIARQTPLSRCIPIFMSNIFIKEIYRGSV